MLWLVLAVALALRAGFGLTREGLTASTDEANWNAQAKIYLHHGLLHPDSGTYRPPFYPLMLAAIYEVCGQSPLAVRLWQAFLGTVTCALLFGIGRHLGGERCGLIAAALGALYPLMVFFCSALMAETLLVLLTTAVVLLALRMESLPTWRNAALTGFVFGLALLCKPVVLPWLPLLLWGWWRRRPQGEVRRAARVALVLGVSALTLAPWTARNAAVTGYFVPFSSNLGMNLMIGNEPQATGVYRRGTDYLGMARELVGGIEPAVARDRALARSVVEQIAESPLRFARLALRKLIYLWSPLALGESMQRNLIALLSSGPLMMLGGWGLWRLRGRPEAWVAGTLLLSLSLVHLVFFAHTRFRLPVDAALMGPAALILDGQLSRWRQRRDGGGNR